jgi:hypothetical protein
MSATLLDTFLDALAVTLAETLSSTLADTIGMKITGAAALAGASVDGGSFVDVAGPSRQTSVARS